MVDDVNSTRVTLSDVLEHAADFELPGDVGALHSYLSELYRTRPSMFDAVGTSWDSEPGLVSHRVAICCVAAQRSGELVTANAPQHQLVPSHLDQVVTAAVCDRRWTRGHHHLYAHIHHRIRQMRPDIDLTKPVSRHRSTLQYAADTRTLTIDPTISTTPVSNHPLSTLTAGDHTADTIARNVVSFGQPLTTSDLDVVVAIAELHPHWGSVDGASVVADRHRQQLTSKQWATVWAAGQTNIAATASHIGSGTNTDAVVNHLYSDDSGLHISQQQELGWYLVNDGHFDMVRDVSADVFFNGDGFDQRLAELICAAHRVDMRSFRRLADGWHGTLGDLADTVVALDDPTAAR